ncbi:alpha/beta-hydrolase [Cadophora sp. DSE1049]|nr:alpha/beta-hydrolase [Cadophora sp. DSE1049]
MSSESPFTIKEHIIPCAHIREDLTTTSNAQEPWRMSIKQYIPISNPHPKEGDVTIIGSHGNGFIKELYEPFWTDLYHFLSTHGIRIRSIWVPTTSPYNTHLNPSLIHDPVSAFDHTRDILHMVNHFRSSIVQPILGIGHSIGASQLAMASVFHPTLFAGLVLMDPILVPDAKTAMAERLAGFAVRRPNEWRTRQEAERYAKVAWKDWDARARRAWNKYALEPVDAKQPMGRTRLTWGRDQEVSSYLQFGHVFPSVAEQEEEDARTGKGRMTQWGNGKGLIFVKGPVQMWKFLPMMSTRVLILCGEKPGAALSEMREVWKEKIGSDAMFGRRGMERRVDIETVEGTGHLLPMEEPGACAERTAVWIREELMGWKERDMEPTKKWRALGNEGREKKAEEWLRGLKGKL